MTVLDQIKDLSTADAWVAMEALWDRLTADGEKPVSPEWHAGELARRDPLAAEGPIAFSDRAESNERIRSRCK